MPAKRKAVGGVASRTRQKIRIEDSINLETDVQPAVFVSVFCSTLPVIMTFMPILDIIKLKQLARFVRRLVARRTLIHPPNGVVDLSSLRRLQVGSLHAAMRLIDTTQIKQLLLPSISFRAINFNAFPLPQLLHLQIRCESANFHFRRRVVSHPALVFDQLDIHNSAGERTDRWFSLRGDGEWKTVDSGGYVHQQSNLCLSVCYTIREPKLCACGRETIKSARKLMGELPIIFHSEQEQSSLHDEISALLEHLTSGFALQGRIRRMIPEQFENMFFVDSNGNMHTHLRSNHVVSTLIKEYRSNKMMLSELNAHLCKAYFDLIRFNGVVLAGDLFEKQNEPFTCEMCGTHMCGRSDLQTCAVKFCVVCNRPLCCNRYCAIRSDEYFCSEHQK